MREVTITPWDAFHEECKITLKDFIEEVKIGFLTDDDGYGVYATEEGYTDVIVYPSTIAYGWVEEKYPYVCWFNK